MEILKFSEPPRRSGRLRADNKSGLTQLVAFGIAVLVLGGMSTTLAGTITLNNDSGVVEFGQGIVTAAACDASIRITPSTTYDTDLAKFDVTRLVVDGIGTAASDTRVATQIAEGCLGKLFTLRAYTETGVALTFTSSTNQTQDAITFRTIAETSTVWGGASSPIEFTPSGISTTGSGDWTQVTGLAPSGNPGTNTGVVTITGFKLPATVTRITLETSG
jgi:hypothetical protein